MKTTLIVLGVITIALIISKLIKRKPKSTDNYTYK